LFNTFGTGDVLAVLGNAFELGIDQKAAAGLVDLWFVAQYLLGTGA
jgi:hypothetical protein